MVYDDFDQGEMDARRRIGWPLFAPSPVTITPELLALAARSRPRPYVVGAGGEVRPLVPPAPPAVDADDWLPPIADANGRLSAFYAAPRQPLSAAPRWLPPLTRGEPPPRLSPARRAAQHALEQRRRQLRTRHSSR